ncbi:hypothetical protein HanXRQr2_Chr09g0417731 [Helianthus annuus]|nr:hypothetical protein HanXRQr2_Chr09g0417731 [Helianthus annuus]
MFDFTSSKELLRAIDVRLETLTQNLSTACGRAVAAGYDHDTVADLQLFAERFGAKRAKPALNTYDRRRRRHEFSWKSDVDESAITTTSSDCVKASKTQTSSRLRARPPY